MTNQNEQQQPRRNETWNEQSDYADRLGERVDEAQQVLRDKQKSWAEEQEAHRYGLSKQAQLSLEHSIIMFFNEIQQQILQSMEVFRNSVSMMQATLNRTMLDASQGELDRIAGQNLVNMELARQGIVPEPEIGVTHVSPAKEYKKLPPLRTEDLARALQAHGCEIELVDLYALASEMAQAEATLDEVREASECDGG